MLKYVEEKLIIKDELKFNNKLCWSVKHFNKLDLNNTKVKQIIKKYKQSYDSVYLIQKLKIFYWTKCENINEFNETVEQYLKTDLNFKNLIS